MVDAVDRAAELIKNREEDYLAALKRLAKPKYPYREGEADFHCHECNVVVPAARRKVTGSELCIDCKEDLE